MCPYSAPWREYFINDLKWLVNTIGSNRLGIYLDQFGGNWEGLSCYAENHGHPVPDKLAPGEQQFIQQIRDNLPAEVVIYSEMGAADSVSQYLDGGYSHAVWYEYRGSGGLLSPHGINLQRFALPDFKLFEKCYYISAKNGNWYLLKQSFFNGLGLCQREAAVNNDLEARRFKNRMFGLLHEYAREFTSSDVEPLVPCLVPGVYINRFSSPDTTVWMIYNSLNRTVRGPLLQVRNELDREYHDVLNDAPVAVQRSGDVALLNFEVGPKGLACVVRRTKQKEQR
jgi:hypothetical protein